MRGCAFADWGPERNGFQRPFKNVAFPIVVKQDRVSLWERGFNGLALRLKDSALGRVEAEALQPVTAGSHRSRSADDDCQVGREHQENFWTLATRAGVRGMDEINSADSSVTWPRRRFAGSGRWRHSFDLDFVSMLHRLRQIVGSLEPQPRVGTAPECLVEPNGHCR